MTPKKEATDENPDPNSNPTLKIRYLFQVWHGIPGLSSYSVLEARIGSLRLLAPSSQSQGLHILAILTAAFGYIAGFVLIVSSSYYQSAKPWQSESVPFAILLAFAVGFFMLLAWEEHSFPYWSLRLASRHPRSFKPVQAHALKPGRFFQEIYALVDGQETILRVEGSPKNVRTALSLARITATEKEARRQTLTPMLAPAKQTPLNKLAQRINRTSINIGAVGFVVFIGLFLTLYFYNLMQDPTSPVWIFAAILFGWLEAALIHLTSKTRRYYCYNCDSYTIFKRQHGEWRCHKCGSATAL